MKYKIYAEITDIHFILIVFHTSLKENAPLDHLLYWEKERKMLVANRISIPGEYF